jgi:hypothetical protein
VVEGEREGEADKVVEVGEGVAEAEVGEGEAL